MNARKFKLILGTVQLGMDYGINNPKGKPLPEEAFAILDAAFKGGIDTFDTAFAYGEAEDVLGKWIRMRSFENKVKIISKLKPHVLNDYPDGAKAIDIIRSEIEKSFKRLGIKQLNGYLFHSPHYIYLSHLIAAMRKVKEEGLTQNIGVSIYDEEEALQAAELGVDYIQVPYNLFDTRLDKTNFFEMAKKNNVSVFSRSPFLQGLLVMEPERVPEHLYHVKPLLHEFIEISNKHNISRPALALLFSCLNSKESSIVFGVDTVMQLKEDLEIVANPPPEINKAIDELKEKFQNISRGIVNPSLWQKVKI